MNNRGKKRRPEANGDSEAFRNKVAKRDQSSESSKSVKEKFTVLNIDQFASKRVIEIQALTDLVKDVGGNHQAFQKVPHHMRRRAMSHNIKRVPRRLHDLVKSELDKVKAPTKRPSRKYRRKPSNLLSEYERRKRRVQWLDTHIWHAKRFKMTEVWGYKLPYHPTDKSIRSCYRAVQKHCLLQDVSYENYIEVKGYREMILDGLRHLTSQDAGPTFAAKMTSNGTKEGSLYLYSFDCYPHKVIGRVTYMWKTGNLDDTSMKTPSSTIWICCHPAFEAQVMDELKKCFGSPSSPDSNDKCDSNKNPVTFSILKNELCKFRLFGPASNLVLKETLKLWDKKDLCLDQALSVTSVNTREDDEKKSDTEMWWRDYYKSKEKQCENENQKKTLSTILSCRSPSEAPPHLVIAATVGDPRLLLPPKRNKVSTFNAEFTGESLQPELFSTEICSSPLWLSDVRENVKSTKMPEKTLNEMRSKQLVPGTKLELGEKESRIPIMIIQRPGLSASQSSPSTILGSTQQQIGYASGWDIVIPAGWAMAFWVALVYQGARVGGQREATSISLQAKQLFGVRDVPDSDAGQKALAAESEVLQTKNDKRPPSKRPNYAKLGFMSPFVFQFNELCKAWLINSKRVKFTQTVEGVTADMYVLRDRSILKALNSVLVGMNGFFQSKNEIKQSTNGIKIFSKQNSDNLLDTFLSTNEGKKLVEHHGNALVPVSVTVTQRGVPVRHAHICIPSKDDFIQLKKLKGFGGPEEMLHKDEDAPMRNAERKQRLKLRKKKKRGNKSVVNVDDQSSKSEKNVEEKEEVKVDPCVVVNKTSRSLIGYVSGGDFDLGQGQGSGVGFCCVCLDFYTLLMYFKLQNSVVVVVELVWFLLEIHHPLNTDLLQFLFKSKYNCI